MRHFILTILAALALVACGDSVGPEFGPDAIGVDTDDKPDAFDFDVADVGVDAPSPDAGSDTGADASPDVFADAGIDAEVGADIEAGTDASPDIPEVVEVIVPEGCTAAIYDGIALEKFFCDEMQTWEEAQETCEAAGLSLASMDDSDEQYFTFNFLREWNAEHGDAVWIQPSEEAYSNWHPAIEPVVEYVSMSLSTLIPQYPSEFIVSCSESFDCRNIECGVFQGEAVDCDCRSALDGGAACLPYDYGFWTYTMPSDIGVFFCE